MKTILHSVFFFFFIYSSASGSHQPVPVVTSGLESTWPVVSSVIIKQTGSRVILCWKASAEESSIVYQIEKSVDSKNFIPVAVVLSGFPNGTGFDYEFREKFHGGVSYRIKQVKQDGSFKIAAESSIKDN